MKSFIKKFYTSSREYILLSVFLILSLILLSFNSNDKLTRFKIISFGTFAFVSDLVSSFSNGSINQLEYESLKKNNAKLMLENSLMRSKVLNTARLESLLGLKREHEHILLASRIISKNGSLFDGRLTFDVGKLDSVKESLPVITDKGLVGIITAVAENYSESIHLYNSSLNIAATISPSNTEGIISWNGSNLIIKNVPTTKNININDEVVTSDFSSIFPPRIPIGRVVRVDASVAGLLRDVVVEPHVDIEATKTAFVLLLNENSIFQDSTKQVLN
jgi:rod shape-determining protein MreC